MYPKGWGSVVNSCLKSPCRLSTGTGKTTTLVKYAEQRPDLRFLYVAFNRSVALEAQRRFPYNVHCKTVHSLAFKDIGRRWESLCCKGITSDFPFFFFKPHRHSRLCRYHSIGKLTPNLNTYSVSFALPKGHGGFKNGKIVTTTINNYLASTDDIITTRHVMDVLEDKPVLHEYDTVYNNTHSQDLLHFRLKRWNPDFVILWFFINWCCSMKLNYFTSQNKEPTNQNLCGHCYVISKLSDQLFFFFNTSGTSNTQRTSGKKWRNSSRPKTTPSIWPTMVWLTENGWNWGPS